MGIHHFYSVVHHKGDDSIPMKNRIIASVSVIAIVTLLVIGTLPPTRGAQFVVAEWDYPDEYGQGIRGVRTYENSTGSWVHFYYCHYDDTYDTYEWNVSVAVKLEVHSMINSTRVGATTDDEGKLYQRHHVLVQSSNGTTIFSQQNFTFIDVDNSTYAPLWLYRYEVVLDFLPELGEFYTATVTYEIFW